MMRLIFLNILLFFCINYVHSQTWIQYNTGNSSIPTNTVLDVDIDGKGHLWLATHIGVVKYDGTNWQTYNTQNSPIPNNACNTIAIQDDSIIWVGTVQGLARFDGVTWNIYTTFNSGLPYNEVVTVEADEIGNIWLGTLEPFGQFGGGATKFDGITWTNYPNIGSSNNVLVIAIAFDSINRPLASGTFSHIHRLDGNLWTSIGGNLNRDIDVDSAGNTCGAGWGINIFENNTWTNYSYLNSPLPNQSFRAILKEDQNIWAGYDGGFVQYDGTSWMIFDSTNAPLTYGAIKSIKLYDSKLLIAVHGEGLLIYDPVSSIDEHNLHFYTSVYPNPAQNNLFIKCLNNCSSITEIKIFNLTGKELLRQPVISSYQTLDISLLANGIYLYKIKINDRYLSGKLIVLKN